MAVSAADIMTSPVVTVSPDADMAEIATVLSGKHISAVPVCDKDGKLAGIISEADVVRPFRESVRARRDWWLGLLSEGDALSQDYLDYMRLDTRSAKDVMVRHVITAATSATVPELAELMIGHGVKHIPILRDEMLVGIVSRADLVTALARAPAMLV